MFHPANRSKLVLALALLCCWTCKAHATDYTYTDGYIPETNSYKDGANESWENFKSWEPEGVPGPGDTATIPGNGVPGSSVFLHSNIIVQNLNLHGVINEDSAPEAANTHSLTVTGTFNWSADAKANSTPSYLGHFNLKEVNIPKGAQFNISGDGEKILECPVNNNGTTTWTGTGIWTGFAPGFVFNNLGTFIASSDSFFGPINSHIGTFNNSGTFIKRGAGTSIFCGTYLPELNGGAYLCSDFNNTGKVDVESGILALGPGTSNRPFNIASNAELDFKAGGPYFLADGAAFRGEGKISVQQDGNPTVSGSVAVDASIQSIHVAIYGTLTVTSGGTLNLGIATPTADNAHSQITFDSASHAVLDGALNVRLASSDALGATDSYRVIAWATDISHTADFASKSGGTFEVKDDGIYVVPASPSPPPNDNVEAAQTITSATGSVTGDSVAATEQYPFLQPGQAEPLYGGRHGGRSVWYKWTAPYSGDVQFDTDGSNFDTLMAAYSSDPDLKYENFLTVAGNDDSAASLSKINFAATQGQLYYIVVDGFQKKGGLVTLNWAMAVQVTPGTVSQTLTSISPVVVPVNGVDETGFLTVDVQGTNFTTDSQVYVNGHPITGGASTYLSSTELQASLNGSYLASEGIVDLQVATGNQITPRALLQVTNYAVGTAPPGGTATVSTPQIRSFKLLSSVEATVTNPGTAPVTVTPAVYGDFFEKVKDAVANFFSWFTGPTVSVIPTGATALTKLDMTVKVPATDVPGTPLLPLPGTALPSDARLIGNDGGNVVSQGGGNVVSQGGGNVVSQGGGNVVSQGGGNLTQGGSLPLQSTPSSEWKLVRGSGGSSPVISNTTVPNDGTPVGAVSVTFDDTSDPKVTELAGKVFAIIVPRYGEINGDGNVNVADVVALLRIYLGLDPSTLYQLLNADVVPYPGVNGQRMGDGTITGQDVNWLLRRVLGLAPATPAG